MAYFQQILTISTDTIRECYIAISNVLEEFLLIALLQNEWWLASEHFIDDAADTPPVHSLTMTLPIYDLRGKVFWGPAECLCIMISLYILLG